MHTYTKPSLARIWRRWEARFMGAGLDYNVLTRFKSTMQDWDDWCRVWSAEADDRMAFGDEAMARGHIITAADAWADAATMYHFGGMFFISDMEQFHTAHQKKLAAYKRAAPLLTPSAERVEIPFEGTILAGYLRRPLGVERPPVVLLVNGFEGVKEESERRTGELLARGLATFSWDGPGRGEAWERLPMTGNYGPATSAVIDYLETRDDVDAGRIGATGPNRGGFLAAKAAATDSRIRAIATTSPGYDRRGTDWDDSYQVAFDLHLFHLDSVEALRERLDQPDLNMEGDAEKIHCPVLVIAGGRDSAEHLSGSERFFAELQGHKEWVVFPDGERNGNNVPFKVRPRAADFLADQLGAKPADRA
jgi:2,6-dihydroxypseudooxynicotine hydrolase